MISEYYAIKCPDQAYFQSTDCNFDINWFFCSFLLYMFFGGFFYRWFTFCSSSAWGSHFCGPAHFSPSERRDGPTPLSLVAMETRRWQHPAVWSASILIPLRGAAECVRSRRRYVTHCKMANARRMVCFVLYIGLGKFFSPLVCDISPASHWTLRGAFLRYVTQRPMLMWEQMLAWHEQVVE